MPVDNGCDAARAARGGSRAAVGPPGDYDELERIGHRNRERRAGTYRPAIRGVHFIQKSELL
jgi:hypothetical protein